MRQPDDFRMKAGQARTSLSRFTIYRKIAEGTFPAQVKININARAGMNPTSIAGSQTLLDSGHIARSTSMTSNSGAMAGK